MKNTLAAFLLLVLAAVCAAQDNQKKEAKPHPDLSGTWVLDKSRSVRNGKFDSTLVIAHHDPELRILRTDVRKKGRAVREYVFYTDGRGESNPYYYGDARFDSDTKWEGRKVVAYICYRRRYKRAKCNGADAWRWQLSADGQRLTHTTSFATGFSYGSPGGVISSPTLAQPAGNKLVYRRAP